MNVTYLLTPGLAFLPQTAQWTGTVVQFCLLLLIIYAVLYFFRGTKAISVLIGIATCVMLLMFLAKALNMKIFEWLLSNLPGVFSTALIVIFQPELRRAFSQLGSRISTRMNLPQKEAIEEIANAVMQMSFRRCGALIVFEGKIGLQALINNGVQLDCRINSLLLQALFYPNSPLHDGALIVKGGRIVAAHTILPLSQDTAVRGIGTRHRAAIGVTEESDAVAVVVSEETGLISAAAGGVLTRDLSEADLLNYLKKHLLDQAENTPMEKTESLITPEDDRS
jgi:diadenylate cyclase